MITQLALVAANTNKNRLDHLRKHCGFVMPPKGPDGRYEWGEADVQRLREAAARVKRYRLQAREASHVA